jgi:cobalamin biosynthesis Mg chelatase CobN
MSKNNARKKSKEQLASVGNSSQQNPQIKYAVQNKPGTIYQRRKRKINRRFLILLALWIVALVLALYFLTRS